MKQTDRIVRRKQQIAGTLRYIENEKQTVGREMLSMDRDARARRLVLLEYCADRCQRHHDRLERLLGRPQAPARGSTARFTACRFQRARSVLAKQAIDRGGKP